MKSLRIGLITCPTEKMRDYYPTKAEPDFLPAEPPFTPDDQILVDELRRRGHMVQPVVWGEDIGRLQRQFDHLVVRSPWDYMDTDELCERFVGWIEALDVAEVRVDNPPPVMKWLIDKQYLLDLEAAGASTVPTLYTNSNKPLILAECFPGWPLIVKPAISGAGVGLVSLESGNEAGRFQEEFTRLCEKRNYLVQPFLPEIRTAGEWSLIYLGGVYSHAAHKRPADGQIMCHAERGGSLRFGEAPAAVRSMGDQVIALMKPAFAKRYPQLEKRVSFPLLYLRLDVIEAACGPLLVECEGVEPELFFRARPGSGQRFASLLEQRSGCSPSDQ